MKVRSLAALIFWLGLGLSPVLANEVAEKSATNAAQSWLVQIDSGNYAKSWTDALNGSRKPLGKLVSRKLNKAQSASSIPSAPDGNYVVMQFDTSFSNKKGAVETVTFVQEKDSKWKAAGYYIK